MLNWATNKVTGKSALLGMTTISESADQMEHLTPSKAFELQVIMTRLTRDLKLHKVPPQELIKVR